MFLINRNLQPVSSQNIDAISEKIFLFIIDCVLISRAGISHQQQQAAAWEWDQLWRTMKTLAWQMTRDTRLWVIRRNYLPVQSQDLPWPPGRVGLGGKFLWLLLDQLFPDHTPVIPAPDKQREDIELISAPPTQIYITTINNMWLSSVQTNINNSDIHEQFRLYNCYGKLSVSFARSHQQLWTHPSVYLSRWFIYWVRRLQTWQSTAFSSQRSSSHHRVLPETTMETGGQIATCYHVCVVKWTVHPILRSPHRNSG